MLLFAKAFLDIALRRQTPAYLPASLLLLALAACAAALMEVMGALLPPPPNGQIPLRIGLEVGMPLVFSWVLLALAHRRARFLQTATALLGVGALALLILYPLDSLIRVLGEDKLIAAPIGVIWAAVFIGYLLACAHIWRSALDTGLLLGIGISLGYLLLSNLLEHRLLAQS
ncbi:MAG: hypothetical protein ABI356_11330 [Steroidobacteraceae bacterium]